MKNPAVDALLAEAAARQQAGRTAGVLEACRRAIALQPDDAVTCNQIGMLLSDCGQFDEAAPMFARALELNPRAAAAAYNLGNALRSTGRSEEAIAAYQRAVDLQPDLVPAAVNLAAALLGAGRLDDAIAALRRLLAICPREASAHNNLGIALKAVNRLDESIAAYQEAIRLNPHDPSAYSNLILTAHYHPDYRPTDVLAAARQFDDRFVKPLAPARRPHANDRSPDRPLRIGYVSADFALHAVGRCLLPLLLAHDRAQVRVYLYSNVQTPDALTAALRAQADVWRNIAGMDDDRAAELVRADQIDILVDLSLHTTDNRLLLFARKPAPVQVSYLGYAGTTGVSTIDYRLSDPYLDPPGADLSCYSEQTVRLAHSYWCFQPVSQFPAVGPLPAQGNGGAMTFGCLNNFCKVSPAALDSWAHVLVAVPGSKLLLHAPAGADLRAVQEHFSAAGVDPGRVKFIGQQDWTQYVATYQRIDLALDPFPYNGGVTTADALWMGVPVVTLVGQTAVGRAGLSQLTNLGLTELVAHTKEEFFAIATKLAGDLPRLSELRRGLRARMRQSPLCDAKGFARDIEAAYRQMWQSWCAQHSAAGAGVR